METDILEKLDALLVSVKHFLAASDESTVREAIAEIKRLREIEQDHIETLERLDD